MALTTFLKGPELVRRPGAGAYPSGQASQGSEFVFKRTRTTTRAWLRRGAPFISVHRRGIRVREIVVLGFVMKSLFVVVGI